jgi:hypothetical protein
MQGTGSLIVEDWGHWRHKVNVDVSKKRTPGGVRCIAGVSN